MDIYFSAFFRWESTYYPPIILIMEWFSIIKRICPVLERCPKRETTFHSSFETKTLQKHPFFFTIMFLPNPLKFSQNLKSPAPSLFHSERTNFQPFNYQSISNKTGKSSIGPNLFRNPFIQPGGFSTMQETCQSRIKKKAYQMLMVY